jgi:hypothetical protein
VRARGSRAGTPGAAGRGAGEQGRAAGWAAFGRVVACELEVP